MRSKAPIDSAGRLVLPKAVRDALKLSPGDELDIEVSSNEVVLRPAASAGMQKESGVWTLRSGQPLSLSAVNETVRRVRSERESPAAKKES